MNAGLDAARRQAWPDAQRHFEDAAAQARAAGHEHALVLALLKIGWLSEWGHNVEHGRRALDECLSHCQRLELPVETAAALASLGKLENDHGHTSLALSLWSQALELFEKGDGHLGQALTLARLGRTHLAQHDFANARPYLERSLALFITLPEPTAEGQVRSSLGQIAFRADRDFELARSYFAQALALLEPNGPADEIALARDGLAGANHYLGLIASGQRITLASRATFPPERLVTIEATEPDGRPIINGLTLIFDEASRSTEVVLNQSGKLRISVQPAPEAPPAKTATSPAAVSAALALPALLLLLGLWQYLQSVWPWGR